MPKKEVGPSAPEALSILKAADQANARTQESLEDQRRINLVLSAELHSTKRELESQRGVVEEMRKTLGVSDAECASYRGEMLFGKQIHVSRAGVCLPAVIIQLVGLSVVACVVMPSGKLNNVRIDSRHWHSPNRCRRRPKRMNAR